MRHLDTDALATFIAVHDFGSFTAAATHLCKTQAAVSISIRRLEERLGHVLIDREKRGIALTSAGDVLMGYARRITKLSDEALHALQNDGPQEQIRIGMPDDYLERFGTPLIREFGAQPRFPRVEIVCDFSAALEMSLSNGGLDLALVTRRETESMSDFLFREQRQWCAAPNSFPEIQRPLPLALFPDACRGRPLILEALSKAQIPWRVAHISSHLSGVLTAVRVAGALTALPASAIPFDLRILGEPEGLPRLQDFNMALVTAAPHRPGVKQVASFLRLLANAPAITSAAA